MRVPAFIHLPADAFAAPAPANPVTRLLARMGAALARWHADRLAAAEIQALDEATLRDIGVTREALLDHLWSGRTRDRVEASLRRNWP